METVNTSGRRKTSVARVFIKSGKGNLTVNNKDLNKYFPSPVLPYRVLQPLKITDTEKNYDIKVTVKGGGSTGQAESVRLAISKALNLINNNFRKVLKEEGLLTRDPRMVERKKYGKKKARKKFQFSKR